MIRKKVCMMGSFAVGKTSLVSRFVHSVFSEKYHTSIGVKIDRKTLEMEGRTVQLMLWDIHGDDEFQRVRASYVKGASGCLFVVDGTRRSTWDEALLLRDSVRSWVGEVPFLLLLNKIDRKEEWSLDPVETQPFLEAGQLVETSAKTGQGVDGAFETLTLMMLRKGLDPSPTHRP